MSSSKEIILNSIKNALGHVNTDFLYADSLFKAENLISGYMPEELVGEFCEKLSLVSGNVQVIEDTHKLADSVERIFEKTGSNSFFGWETERLIPVYDRLVKKGYIHNKIIDKIGQSECDIGITLADYAISETGTIALYSDKVRIRNASLIVPIHIAILPKEKIVRNIFDLFEKTFNDYSELNSMRELSACITFITGPSRTADIELSLTLGVHGPKELYVLII